MSAIAVQRAILVVADPRASSIRGRRCRGRVRRGEAAVFVEGWLDEDERRGVFIATDRRAGAL